MAFASLAFGVFWVGQVIVKTLGKNVSVYPIQILNIFFGFLFVSTLVLLISFIPAVAGSLFLKFLKEKKLSDVQLNFLGAAVGFVLAFGLALSYLGVLLRTHAAPTISDQFLSVVVGSLLGAVAGWRTVKELSVL